MMRILLALVPGLIIAPARGEVLSFAGRLSTPVLQVRAVADGTVTEVMTTEGQRVKKGEMLLRMDSRREEALLNIGRAKLEAAQTNYARLLPLHQAGSVSREEIDRAASTLSIARAEIELAQLELAATRVACVLEGVVVDCAVQPGQFISKGTLLMTIVKTSELKVEFRVPDKDLPRLAAGQSFSIVSRIADRKCSGEISFISPVVDTESGTAVVKGRIAPDEALRPGMPVDVLVNTEKK